MQNLPDELVEQRERFAAGFPPRWLTSLPQRRALVDHELQWFSHEEIAAELDLSTGQPSNSSTGPGFRFATPSGDDPDPVDRPAGRARAWWPPAPQAPERRATGLIRGDRWRQRRRWPLLPWSRAGRWPAASQLNAIRQTAVPIRTPPPSGEPGDSGAAARTARIPVAMTVLVTAAWSQTEAGRVPTKGSDGAKTGARAIAAVKGPSDR